MGRFALGVSAILWCSCAHAQTVYDVTTTSAAASPGYLPLFQQASVGGPTSMVANSMVTQNGLSTGATGIGIGTQIPKATLDVNGSVNVEGPLTLTPFVTATAGGGGQSNAIYLTASAWNSSTNSPETEAFSWSASPCPASGACAPPASQLVLQTGLPGSKQATLLSISNAGAVTASGPISATSTSGGTAGNFRGGVSVQGAVTGLSVSATSSVVATSAVVGTNTATSGTGTNGGTFSSSSPQGAGVVGMNTSGGYAGYFQGPVTVQGMVGIGTSSPQSQLDVNGTVRTGAITITGGADFAETFLISGNHILPGTVVIIDEDRPGQLKLSERVYDTRVAGIVSGANGVQAGISMGLKGTPERGRQNVALNGRVYALVDTSNGPIRPGDLLTTSGTPGYAMKVTDHAKAQGATLGKAMSALSEGKGMVLVLVTLQ